MLDACEQAYQNGYAAGLAAAGVHIVDGCDCVSNAKVFGLEDSIRRAKFPMSVDPEALSKELQKVSKHSHRADVAKVTTSGSQA